VILQIMGFSFHDNRRKAIFHLFKTL